jgi:hypothetical protein
LVASLRKQLSVDAAEPSGESATAALKDEVKQLWKQMCLSPTTLEDLGHDPARFVGAGHFGKV